jgi:uncharacterized coiled-coil protein SlyX
MTTTDAQFVALQGLVRQLTEEWLRLEETAVRLRELATELQEQPAARWASGPAVQPTPTGGD